MVRVRLKVRLRVSPPNPNPNPDPNPNPNPNPYPNPNPNQVRQYEDHAALCGGTDGADVIRDLLRVAPRLLRADGPRAIWLEVGSSESVSIGKRASPPASERAPQ